MEVIRLVQPVDGAESSRCVICEHLVDLDARCEHCGAATRLRGLRVTRLLAQRPYSRVYIGERDGQQVALKELSFGLVPSTAELEAFEREAQLLGTLDHPAIPRLIESFTMGSGVHTRLYLARELVEGRSLLEKLAVHRFTEPEILGIARQVLGVLRYLHELSPTVVHRDIKPANLIERPDGRLALVDFGTAREIGLGGTLGSTLVGTLGYMPPEQLGGTVDATADLYALGATLLHLLTRREPSELLGPSLRLDFEAEINATPRTRRLLSRLLSRSTTGRFVSAAAALTALDAPAEVGAVGSVGINAGAYRALRQQAPAAARLHRSLFRAGPFGLLAALVAAGVGLGSWAFNAARAGIAKVGATPAGYPALPQAIEQVGAAVAALDHENYPAAIAHAEGAIASSPGSVEASQALLVKAHALLRMGRPKEARKLLEVYVADPLAPHREAAAALLAEIERVATP